MENDLNKAYTLFQRSIKSRAILEDVLRIFLRAELESRGLDSSLRRSMYWGLMTVEKELSCCRCEMAEKMAHIDKAQEYSIEVAKIVSQSSDASLDAQLSLEQHIIKGKKALLDFRMKKDVNQLKISKSEAKGGIEASLGKLREVDPKSYNNVVDAAMEWHEKFSS